MQEITLRTDRRTQLVDITALVQEALGPTNGAAAALVYVPHTTAAVTINEGADPAVARDLENALEKVVNDDWDWKHVEDPDGPNAPSHIRASLISPPLSAPPRPMLTPVPAVIINPELAAAAMSWPMSSSWPRP